jgi:uncharacterized spore protein YtfJ
MSLVEKIAESAKSFGVHTAYGDIVQVDGKEVLPVALVGYGFGGGDGDGTYGPDGKQGSGRGQGAGGGGWAIPIGAYVTNDEGTVGFKPNLIAALAVGIPFVAATGFALATVLRSLK